MEPNESIRIRPATAILAYVVACFLVAVVALALTGCGTFEAFVSPGGGADQAAEAVVEHEGTARAVASFLPSPFREIALGGITVAGGGAAYWLRRRRRLAQGDAASSSSSSA